MRLNFFLCFLLLSVSSLYAMDSAESKAEDAGNTTECEDDAFFRSMLAVSRQSSDAFNKVEEALRGSTNRYKDLMEDAPAVGERRASLISSIGFVDEPGNYCMPGIFGIYQTDGSCKLKLGFVPEVIEDNRDRYKANQYEINHAGQQLSDNEQGGEWVVLLMASIFWSGESVSATQAQECFSDIASSRPEVWEQLVDGSLKLGKDEGEYLLYIACKEECRKLGGLEDKESVRGLFWKTVCQIVEDESLDETPLVRRPRQPLPLCAEEKELDRGFFAGGKLNCQIT